MKQTTTSAKTRALPSIPTENINQQKMRALTALASDFTPADMKTLIETWQYDADSYRNIDWFEKVDDKPLYWWVAESGVSREILSGINKVAYLGLRNEYKKLIELLEQSRFLIENGQSLEGNLRKIQKIIDPASFPAEGSEKKRLFPFPINARLDDEGVNIIMQAMDHDHVPFVRYLFTECPIDMTDLFGAYIKNRFEWEMLARTTPDEYACTEAFKEVNGIIRDHYNNAPALQQAEPHEGAKSKGRWYNTVYKNIAGKTGKILEEITNAPAAARDMLDVSQKLFSLVMNSKENGAIEEAGLPTTSVNSKESGKQPRRLLPSVPTMFGAGGFRERLFASRSSATTEISSPIQIL